MGNTVPDRGYGYKPPTTPKKKPADTGDERSYRYSAPKVSDLYQLGLDNNLDLPRLYKDYNVEQGRIKQENAMMQAIMAGIQPSGGGDGSGGSGGSSAAAQGALQSLFQMWQRPADNTLSDNLAKIVGQAQQTGTGALQTLQSQLGTQTNPYAKQYAAPQVAENPLAQYMQAGGVDSSGVDSLRSLLQSSSQQATAADQANMDRMSQSWQNAQQSRQGDAAFLGNQFQQALANSQAAYQAQIVMQQQAAKDQLMKEILQMAVSSGQDLGKLGITF